MGLVLVDDAVNIPSRLPRIVNLGKELDNRREGGAQNRAIDHESHATDPPARTISAERLNRKREWIGDAPVSTQVSMCNASK
jgi:hypothetical protein